jgi:hypothetical protein
MRHPSRDLRFRRGWALALTSLAFFMVGLDGLVVRTGLPAVHRDLGASLASLQWTVNAYSLAWVQASRRPPLSATATGAGGGSLWA